MWSRENEQSQKLNFASVAATGGLAPTPPVNSSKFMEDIQTQTQVDITKAPGYRGNAVCSPVSTKSSSSSMPLMSGYSGGFPDQSTPSLSVANSRPSIEIMNTNVSSVSAGKNKPKTLHY